MTKIKFKKYFVNFFHNYFQNEPDVQDDDKRVNQDLISVRLKLVNGSISSVTIISESIEESLRRLPPVK